MKCGTCKYFERETFTYSSSSFFQAATQLTLFIITVSYRTCILTLRLIVVLGYTDTCSILLSLAPPQPLLVSRKLPPSLGTMYCVTRCRYS